MTAKMNEHDWEKMSEDDIRREGPGEQFTEKPQPGRPVILSEEQALARLTPQDWLVQNMIEKGFIYALTGTTGSGKTAVALLIAYLMGNSGILPLLGKLEVERGRAIFLAGENPTDIFRRMKALRVFHRLVSTTNIGVIEGVFSIADHYERVRADIATRGPADLIILDTAAAFSALNGIVEENSNAEMGKYAQMLRTLTRMPGNPAVLVLCHPAKGASDRESMIPRGGSAFVAEIDGNIALLPVSKRIVELTHTAKLRGPGFEPMSLEMLPVTAPEFTDKKGRQGWSVVARYLEDADVREKEGEAVTAGKAILSAIAHSRDQGMRQAQLVELTGLSKATVSETCKELKERSLIKAKPLEKFMLIATAQGKVAVGVA